MICVCGHPDHVHGVVTFPARRRPCGICVNCDRTKSPGRQCCQDETLCGCTDMRDATMVVPTQDGLYPGISDAVYHADRGSLSSSGARQLLRAPAKFRYEQDHGSPHRDVFDFGSAAHTLVLGAGDEIAPIDADSWRSKDAQERRDDARKHHRIPLLVADYDKARAMADAVHKHPIANELFADGVAEQSGFWTDEATWLRLRFRPDWITQYQGAVTLVDYKTAQTADPKTFARKAFDFGYHFQAAWYVAGYEAVTGEAPRFLFIVQEKEPPYLVSVVEFDDAALCHGAVDVRTAVDIYAACIESNIWPGYGTEIHNISVPAWARRGTAA